MTATFVVVNGIQKAFNWNRPWLGLLVAQVIVVGGSIIVAGISAANIFIAVINGFLVFLSAAGLTEAASNTQEFQPQSLGDENRRRFLDSWFRR